MPPVKVGPGSWGTLAVQTFGCKANQYDGERILQALASVGWHTAEEGMGTAEVVVVNTCTVTARADAEARRAIRRLHREAPGRRVVVVGCSAALHAARYLAMPEVDAVVPGHDLEAVVRAVGAGSADAPVSSSTLVQLEGAPLRRRVAGTRGWLRIQDGCDRKCSFCATRLARGSSRSRSVEAVVREARALALDHPELVLTGIHIGHWGRDLIPVAPPTLATLVRGLASARPDAGPNAATGPRLRLGSIEATEVDDGLLSALLDPTARLAPHLHMPLQSGSDRILRAMRRWHTRDDYRRRTLEIAEALTARGPTTLTGGPVLGLGADLITGFPGETDADHRDTVRLVEELPFTYLHVFPFSPREGTPAAELAREHPVPQRVAAERARELRELGQAKGEAYLASRVRARVEVVVERERPDGTALGLTEDYLRLPVEGRRGEEGPRLWSGVIERDGERAMARVGSGTWIRATPDRVEGETEPHPGGPG